MNRRDFLKTSSVAVAALAAARITPLASAADTQPRPLPTIKLGSLEVSRLILGSNPFGGWAHRPGKVGDEMKAYYTEDRIIATLEEAAACGLATVSSPPDPEWRKLWARYTAGGGRIKTWLAQMHGSADKMSAEIEEAVQAGAQAVFIQGHRVEEQFEKGTFAAVRTWLEKIHALGVPAGLAAHRTDVHLAAQKEGFPVDFYYQCFYNVAHGDTFVRDDPPKAIEVIRQLQKPVIAYKILGAGRVPAKEGFEFALKNIRPTDGVCIGIYTKDQPDQLKEDAELVRRLSRA